ncbi:MAG TPA: hypothetical protein VKV21_16320 [Solirubrobacteraceae bacterium]|nr:hypothetical protein [Solirubrobacteraceae bacterium]
MRVRELYAKLTDDAQQERAFLSAAGFTTAFAACRAITHAIRAEVGPFHNISSKSGTHIHHSTFGIFGLLGIGYLWTNRIFVGNDARPRWGSRVTATAYGVAAALTLDEFALWLDLHDDYWDAKGRKSVDAVAIFGGILSVSVIASEAIEELGYGTRLTGLLKRLDIRRELPPPAERRAGEGGDGP